MKLLNLRNLFIISTLIGQFHVNAQEQLIDNYFIGADKKIDSLFRVNFRFLEKYDQIFKIKNPEFSMTEFYEPENKDVYKFVELLTRISGIQCNSEKKQEGWYNSYCTWDNHMLNDWESWYTHNAKGLKWQEIISIKDEIDKKWANK
jgi:hypothetical protein